MGMRARPRSIIVFPPIAILPMTLYRYSASFVAVCVLAALLALPVHAQDAPTFEEVAGHAFGERVTLNHQANQYVEAVADASDRVVMEHEGESWQGRDLTLAIVTAPENHERLDEIQENAQQLGDPRDLTDEEAAAIIEEDDQPAIFWFGGSIHGNELSGSEASLKMLERLATQDDPETMSILDNTVLLIAPILNPDGRDTFAHKVHDNLGREANPDNNDWSNDFTGWEGLQYRTSHYYFDINRDWFAHTHPETESRLETIQAWNPQAGVDAHEMGADVEFYIDPPTDPVAPFFPEYAMDWFEDYGEEQARALDEVGADYMTRERFNYFYPGYTTSHLSYQGAVGMLYEQGSSRGLALTRPDGTERTLEDATRQQYAVFEGALNLTANERENILQDYVDAHRDAIADGQDGIQRYLITPEHGDPHLVAEVADLLRRNNIEVERLDEETTLGDVRDRTGDNVGSHTFPEGTYVVEAAQPRNRYVRTLLEPHTPVPDDFLEEARERIDRGESPRFYDITAWSLPLMFNVEGFSTTDGQSIPTTDVTDPVTVDPPTPGTAEYAYLIDGNQAAGLPALYHIKEKGHRVAMLQASTRIEGTDYASGTGVVYAAEAGEDVHEDVRTVADRYNVAVDPVDTGLAEGEHPSLGSEEIIYLEQPSIAFVAENPVHAYSFGWGWYTLDRQYEVPMSVLRSESVAGTDLSDYNVLVFPDVFSPEALQSTIGESGMERIENWIQDGGTLVTIGSSTEIPRSMEWTALRSWYDIEGHEDAQRISAPGAMVRTDLDREHWLTAGVPDDLTALVNSSHVYLPPEGPPSAGQRAGVTYAENGFHASGHMWEESEERLPGAVFAYEERVGNGRVISFAEDVNFRGYWRAADRLFLNATIVGPSAP